MRNIYRRLTAFAAASCLFLTLSAPAFAQDDGGHPGHGDPAFLIFLMFSPYTLTSTGITSTVVGVVLTVNHLQDDIKEESEAIMAYVRQNAPAVQHDLMIGAGQTVDDLASIFNVPSSERAEFAGALRQERHMLQPLIHSEMKLHEADAFIAVIRDLAAETPTASGISGT